MKAKEKKISDELRSEYIFDYSKAVRGKWLAPGLLRGLIRKSGISLEDFIKAK